jgi:hypothetical protein
MLGEGMESLGVTFSTVDRRNRKSSPKIVSTSVTFSLTCKAAEVNSRSPSSLWNWTVTFSEAWLIPPSR